MNYLSDEEIRNLKGHYFKTDDGSYIYITEIKICGVFVDAFGIVISGQSYSLHSHLDFGLWCYEYDDNDYTLPESQRHYRIKENLHEVTKEEVSGYLREVFGVLSNKMNLT